MDHHHFDTLAVALSAPQSRRGTVRLLGLVLAGGTVTIGGIAVVPPAAARKRKPKPRKPIQLPTGETRTFLQDGDEVVMRAYCEREGFRRIGFGECRGRIEG